MPTRYCATCSIGFCVADKPMRCSGCFTRFCSRSSDSDRCEPRLSPISAWISSRITVLTLASSCRPPLLVSSRYSDSGVVTSMWGGFFSMAWRSVCGVSPVRTATLISTGAKPNSGNRAVMPASGTCRLRWMSLPSAFRGDTYSTEVWLR